MSRSYARSERAVRPGWVLAALGTVATTALTPNRSLALPLPLCARLLVEAALAELGIEARPLDLALETAQGPVEAFVLLNDDFQEDLQMR